MQDLDVFETHQGLEDLVRVGQNKGASCFFGSHLNLKPGAPLFDCAGPLLPGGSPLKSEEPYIQWAQLNTIRTALR